MKKFLFFALAAAFAFTSCTQDETLATAQKGAIAFAPAADKATRSVYDPSITTANIDNFAVYGFMNNATGVVFNDELVSRNGGAWTYANTQYWTPNTYYFAALAPSNGRAWELTAASGDAAKLGVGTIDFTNDGTQDLLYWAGVSDNTANGVEDQPVSILFNHLLSKVKFSFVNNMDNANAKLIVKNIVITNAETKGTLNLAVENWWDGENDWSVNTTAPFAFGNAAVTSETAEEQIAQYAEIESYKHMLLFPVNNKKFEVTFTVELWMGNAIAATYNHTSEVTTTLEMGKAYDFKAVLNADNVTGSTDPEDQLKPIKFEVEVIDWEEAGQVILPEYKPVVVEDEAQFRAALEVGGEILLANDITTTAHFVIPEGANVTLNLNGKTLKGGVEYTGTQTGAEISAITVDGGNLTIEGLGNIQGAVYGVYAKNKGTLTIRGGNFTAETSAVQVGEATVEINGGNFSATDADKRYVINCLDADYTAGRAKVAIKGGKFADFNPADNAAEGVGTNFVAAGYKSVEVEANVWEVVAEVVAK